MSKNLSSSQSSSEIAGRRFQLYAKLMKAKDTGGQAKEESALEALSLDDTVAFLATVYENIAVSTDAGDNAYNSKLFTRLYKAYEARINGDPEMQDKLRRDMQRSIYWAHKRNNTDAIEVLTTLNKELNITDLQIQGSALELNKAEAPLPLKMEAAFEKIIEKITRGRANINPLDVWRHGASGHTYDDPKSIIELVNDLAGRIGKMGCDKDSQKKFDELKNNLKDVVNLLNKEGLLNEKKQALKNLKGQVSAYYETQREKKAIDLQQKAEARQRKTERQRKLDEEKQQVIKAAEQAKREEQRRKNEEQQAKLQKKQEELQAKRKQAEQKKALHESKQKELAETWLKSKAGSEKSIGGAARGIANILTTNSEQASTSKTSAPTRTPFIKKIKRFFGFGKK